jgi:antitoxin (DNA-binding transcriptional repressor) of toxin-antitoxin stability system
VIRGPKTGSRKPRGVVGVRELRVEVSAVVAALEGGDWFLVSKRGSPVGVLLPSAMAEDLLKQNAAEIVELQLRRRRKTPGQGATA